MSAFPVRHHPSPCLTSHCPTCLADHLAISDHIYNHTGAVRRFHDMLGEYRTWMDDHGIPAEDEAGWGTYQFSDRRNVDAFIDEWLLDMVDVAP